MSGHRAHREDRFVAALGLWTAFCWALSADAADPRPHDALIRAHIIAGEFAPAIALAQRSASAPQRDTWLAEIAAAQARAGAHVVGPSGMMDGQVAAIRAALDEAGFLDTAILAYSAKYASAFFGPFRDAVGSSLRGDRLTYQQDPANRREGVREAMLDLDEGADLVMVKPAGSYLDVLADVAAASPVPVAAYQVSGEYAMVEAAAANGWLDRERAIDETVTAIVRAGADVVLTYWALELAGRLR